MEMSENQVLKNDSRAQAKQPFPRQERLLFDACPLFCLSPLTKGLKQAELWLVQTTWYMDLAKDWLLEEYVAEWWVYKPLILKGPHFKALGWGQVTQEINQVPANWHGKLMKY